MVERPLNTHTYTYTLEHIAKANTKAMFALSLLNEQMENEYKIEKYESLLVYEHLMFLAFVYAMKTVLDYKYTYVCVSTFASVCVCLMCIRWKKKSMFIHDSVC